MKLLMILCLLLSFAVIAQDSTKSPAPVGEEVVKGEKITDKDADKKPVKEDVTDSETLKNCPKGCNCAVNEDRDGQKKVAKDESDEKVVDKVEEDK